MYSDVVGSLDIVDYIYDIRDSLRALAKVTVNFNPRSSNSMADMLAKRASNLESDILEWCS